MGKEISAEAREKRRAASKQWAIDNPERVKDYYQKNKERKKEQSRLWREANPERIKELRRIWKAANPDYDRKHAREWARENPERVKEVGRLWREKNRERGRETSREWRKKNPEWAKEHGLKGKARRKRSLGWVKLAENPFPPGFEVDWHHVDKTHVVAVPTSIHRANLAGSDTERHRELMAPYVEQIYGDITGLTRASDRAREKASATG